MCFRIRPGGELCGRDLSQAQGVVVCRALAGGSSYVTDRLNHLRSTSSESSVSSLSLDELTGEFCGGGYRDDAQLPPS